jgi:deoxyribonuclease V
MRADEARPVLLQGQPVAWALKTTGQAKPIFVSPGHRVDLPFALAQTRRLIRGRRVPEPIRHAHAISRSACNIR